MKINSAKATKTTGFELLRELPQEIVHERILGLYCDGKSLSTLAFVSITATTTSKSQCTIILQKDNYFYLNLVWKWIPKICQQRLNTVIDQIENQTTTLKSSIGKKDTSDSYALDAIAWLRCIVETRVKSFEQRNSLICSWNAATIDHHNSGRNINNDTNYYRYCCQKQMQELSELLVVLDFVEISVQKYSCPPTIVGSCYQYEWPVWCGRMVIDTTGCNNHYIDGFTSSTTKPTLSKHEQQHLVHVVMTAPIMNRPICETYVVPGYAEILDHYRRYTNWRHSRLHDRTQTDSNTISVAQTAPPGRWETQLLYKKHMFRCEPHNVIPIQPWWGKVRGISDNDQFVLDHYVASALVSSDQVAIPRQRFVSTTIDDDRCSLNVRILTQQQCRNRRRRHMIRSNTIDTPSTVDSNRIFTAKLPTDWILGEDEETYYGTHTDDESPYTNKNKIYHNSATNVSTGIYKNELLCCWDNEIFMSDDDRQLGRELYVKNKCRSSIGGRSNTTNVGNDPIDPLCIVYMIHLLKRMEELVVLSSCKRGS